MVFGVTGWVPTGWVPTGLCTSALIWGRGWGHRHPKYNARCMLCTCTLPIQLIYKFTCSINCANQSWKQGTIATLPYSGKFSRILVFTDQLRSAKIKTSKFLPVCVRIRKYMDISFIHSWPVYGCGFTYRGYPWKLKCENVQSDQSVQIFTLKNFPLATRSYICYSNWDTGWHEERQRDYAGREPINGQYYEFKQRVKFFKGTTIFCSDIHHDTHLELKYLKVSVPTLIWVCYG